MDPFVPKKADIGEAYVDDESQKSDQQEDLKAHDSTHRGLAFRKRSGSGSGSAPDPYALLSNMFGKKEQDLNPGFVGNIPVQLLAQDEKLSIWERLYLKTRKHFDEGGRPESPRAASLREGLHVLTRNDK